MSKRVGIAKERELVHKFSKAGFVAFRIPGSGATGLPDVVAGNALRKLAIECKYSSYKTIYIKRKYVDQLKKIANKMGAEPWFAVKIARYSWFFMNIEDLKKTKDNNYLVDYESMKIRGLLFEELIS